MSRNKKYQLPVITVIISFLTLSYSFSVALEVSGSFFGKIRITQLEPYGGVTVDHLLDLELWRLFLSQLVHVKQLHMIYNVISFYILGLFIERQIGSLKLFSLWFLSGAVGTVFSSLFVSPPWNLGTGASQAVFGLSACAVLMLFKGIETSNSIKYAIAFVLVPALILDLIFSHYPKPGHVLSFTIGLAISYVFLKSAQKQSEV